MYLVHQQGVLGASVGSKTMTARHNAVRNPVLHFQDNSQKTKRKAGYINKAKDNVAILTPHILQIVSVVINSLFFLCYMDNKQATIRLDLEETMMMQYSP